MTTVNVNAINRAIQVMEWVQEQEREKSRTLLNMGEFQKPPRMSYTLVNTAEEALNLCGTTCCFSGWLAIHPLFPELKPGLSGEAIFSSINSYGTVHDLSHLLGVPYEEVSRLVYNAGGPLTIMGVISRLKYWRDYL